MCFDETATVHVTETHKHAIAIPAVAVAVAIIIEIVLESSSMSKEPVDVLETRRSQWTLEAETQRIHWTSKHGLAKLDGSGGGGGQVV